MNYEFDTIILDNLPVTIEFDTTEYNNSDVGGGINDVDNWSIVAIDGKICRSSPRWIYEKLTSLDESRIIEECHEHKGYC